MEENERREGSKLRVIKRKGMELVQEYETKIKNLIRTIESEETEKDRLKRMIHEQSLRLNSYEKRFLYQN